MIEPRCLLAELGWYLKYENEPGILARTGYQLNDLV